MNLALKLLSSDCIPGEEENPFLEFLTEPDDELIQNERAAERLASFDPNSFFLGFHNIPIVEATKGQLLVGSIGSGKTTQIDLYVKSIAPRFKQSWNRPEQLIIFDPKGDNLSLLASLGLGLEEENVWYFHPTDFRGSTWSLADAAQEPAMVRYIATLLVPPEPQSSAPFFTEASRELVIATILGLNACAGKNWTLRDLLCALESRKHIHAVSRKHPRAKCIAERILNDERHSDAVISTIGTKLGKFETVAALWATCPHDRKFSVEKFLSSPGVLILGSDAVLKDSLSPIRASLLNSLCTHILRQHETDQPRFWFILDEFRSLERADSVRDLANYGRSKGCSVLCAIQTIESLVELYGEAVCNDFLSHLAYKIFLRAGGVQTAEWAERYFGKIRAWEPSFSQSFEYGVKHTFTRSESLQDRAMLLASVFLSMPLPAPGGNFCAISDLPCFGQVFLSERPFAEVTSWRPRRIHNIASQPRTSISDQTLWPWTDKEEKRFCASPHGEEASTELNAAQSEPYLPARKKTDNGQSELFS